MNMLSISASSFLNQAYHRWVVPEMIDSGIKGSNRINMNKSPAYILQLFHGFLHIISDVMGP